MTLLRLRPIAVGMVALVALLGGCTKSPQQPAKKAATNVISFAPGSPELASIDTVVATSQPLPISADLNARLGLDEGRTSRISAPVAGRVLRVVADIGQPVTTGQALAIVDAPDIGQARADALKASAESDLKARALQRATVLYGGDAIARQDVEAAQADAASARAELQRSRLRLANLGPGQGNLLTISSAIPGYVVEREITPGQQIGAGAGTLFTVSDPRKLWLYVDVPETATSRVRVGQRIQFGVPAWPGRRFDATITEVGLLVNPGTRRVQVRASVANADLALKPEMYARATLIANDGRRAIEVPNGALFEEGSKSFVFRVEAPGRFRRVPVTVGERGSKASYLTGGIRPGDRIVGEGALLLNAQLNGN